MSDLAISVNGISKRYRLGLRDAMPDTFARMVASWIASPVANFRSLRKLGHFNDDDAGASTHPADVLYALRDVSFDVKKGEVVGIIGRNGAGKSTLLKVLSRIAEPTAGTVHVYGRVASLLEVGTGFHPDLTGRENVYLNGTMLGMRKAEIDAKFDEIAAFAEINAFLDTPVKRYSSGMYVRLAFAVAAHLEPEILIIDEVLAVGDAAFQAKCLGKIGEVAETEGRTVLFVSHSMQAVRSLCDRAVLLNGGQIERIGDVGDTVDAYLSHTHGGERYVQQWSSIHEAPGNGVIRIRRVEARAISDPQTGTFAMSTAFAIEVEYWLLEPHPHASLDLVVYAADGTVVFESYAIEENPDAAVGSDTGLFRTTCRIPGDLFNAGTYRVRVQFVDESSRPIVNLPDALMLTIHDTDARRLSWYGRCYGPVHPRLAWATERLGNASE